MNALFDSARTVIKARYAVVPKNVSPSHLPGWSNVVSTLSISPTMGAKFSQILIGFKKNGRGSAYTGNNEYFVFVLSGKCTSVISGKKQKLVGGSYAYIPPQEEFQFNEAGSNTRLIIFQKKYEPLDGFEKPDPIVSHQNNVRGEPFLGNNDARLQELLPENSQFDMAVNILTYQPGAMIPFAETRPAEQALAILSGQGMYRFDTDYHPVQTGDAVWIAPFCPQWFVAMGRTPTSYIYCTNANRAPS